MFFILYIRALTVSYIEPVLFDSLLFKMYFKIISDITFLYWYS